MRQRDRQGSSATPAAADNILPPASPSTMSASADAVKSDALEEYNITDCCDSNINSVSGDEPSQSLRARKGWGNKSVNSLLTEVEAKKTIPFDR